MEPDENLISYRLSEVEKAVRDNNEHSQKRDQELHRKLDNFLEVKDTVTKNTYHIESLLKSRDRQIAALTTVVVGMVMLYIQEIFRVV